ncbi:MAG: hypothetical protein QOK05_1319 [Chloroflexota bacterium]|jgi:hypothetical protein|nr:hypothetical protein [Chloroflexota bacterium]
MRLPNAEQEARPWRVHEITRDFRLEDVWALPVQGGAGDFGRLLGLMTSFDPAHSSSRASRLLFGLRHLLGGVFGWDEEPGRGSDRGTRPTTLKERLPRDLRDNASGLDLGSEALGVHFAPLYRTDVEFAAELSNQTMHGVIHLAWVDLGKGLFRGQMAIYVQPRGMFGEAYLALIRPFRYGVVYPALMRQVEQAWGVGETISGSGRAAPLRPSARARPRQRPRGVLRRQ